MLQDIEQQDEVIEEMLNFCGEAAEQVAFAAACFVSKDACSLKCSTMLLRCA